jgi:hypothetical protein
VKRTLFFICGVLLALVSFVAIAEEKLTSLPEKYFKVKLYSDHLEFYTQFKDELKKAQQEKLNNGFTTTILVRAYLYDVANPTVPISISVHEAKVVYDLWEELYTIQISEPGNVTSKTTEIKDDAIKIATTVDSLPLYFDTELSSDSTYLVAIIVEVNPLSQELLAETRKWLSRTSGSSAKAGKSSSFFGSFVSIFVNVRQGTAEYTTKFRSLAFSPPKKAQQ